MEDFSLETRTALPDALRELIGGPPRAAWEAHPNFGRLTRFWLQRHLLFRRLLGELRGDATARADGTLDPEEHARRLRSQGGLFLSELHGHHGIEDTIYFPRMVEASPAVARAFDLLDADHVRLHDELDRFASDANALLGGQRGPAALEARLDAMTRFLDRHLTDEEEVVVPVILRLGEERLA